MQKHKRGLTLTECIALGVATLAVAVAAVTLSSPGNQAGRSLPAKTPAATESLPDASADTTADTPATTRPPQVPGTKGGSPTPANALKTEPPAPTGPVVVTVTGAVNQPGKFTLAGGDRVYQAVRAAGGLKENAAVDTLDLTERLRSGQKIFVPTRPAKTPPPIASSSGAAVPPSAAFPSSPPPAPPETPAPTEPERITVRPPAPRTDGTNLAPAAVVPAPESRQAAIVARRPAGTPVNINTATAADLQRLPGVGPTLAERILAYRKEVGRFHSPEQMLDVRGITEDKFAAMEPLLRVR